jgi:hypothetical protein
MEPPTLSDTQRLLWRLITAPSGVADCLRRMGEGAGPLAGGLDTLLDGDAVLPATRRLDIYANMYFFRLLDALREDFPVLATTLGAEEFHNLVTDYLLQHPPTHPSLRWAGLHLPRHLQQHRLADSFPHAAELATFEWALVEAFDAADDDLLAPEALAELAPEGWAALRLRMSPSLQLLALENAVHETWQTVRDGGSAAAPATRAAFVRVWRRDLRVFHREIERDEFVALQASATGETFAALCERMAELVGEEPAARRMGDLLQVWLADGLLVSRTWQDASRGLTGATPRER